MEIINPVILEHEKGQLEVEGCLSVPGVYSEANVLKELLLNIPILMERVKVEGTDLLALLPKP